MRLKKARDDEAALRSDARKGDPSVVRDWREALRIIENAEGQLPKALIAALDATQDAYGVGGGADSGRVRGGVFHGQRTSFRPVIQESDMAFYEAKRGTETLHLKWAYDSKELGSDILDDGSVVISIRVLERCRKLGSPAALAAAVDYEHSRWSHLTNGWIAGDYDKLHAYDSELETAAKIGLETEEVAAIEKRRQEHWLGAVGTGMRRLADRDYRAGPSSNDYPYAVRPGGEPALEKDWMAHRDGLAAIRNQQDRLKASVDAATAQREEERRLEESANARERWRRRAAAKEKLFAFTSMICAWDGDLDTLMGSRTELELVWPDLSPEDSTSGDLEVYAGFWKCSDWLPRKLLQLRSRGEAFPDMVTLLALVQYLQEATAQVIRLNAPPPRAVPPLRAAPAPPQAVPQRSTTEGRSPPVWKPPSESPGGPDVPNCIRMEGGRCVTR